MDLCDKFKDCPGEEKMNEFKLVLLYNAVFMYSMMGQISQLFLK